MLAGLLRTAGSFSASWNCGVWAARANASVILPPTVENSTDRKTAVPSVPPICRKNVADDVATPMSCGGTAFCTASTSGCMTMPRPRPNTGMYRPITHSAVSAPMRVNSTAPTTISAAPTIG